MFTQADLVAGVRAGEGAGKGPRLSVWRYDQDDFTSRESEQAIRIYMARKPDCDGALQFWLAALRSEDWSPSGAEAGTCAPMSRSEFATLIRSHAEQLKRPVPSEILDPSRFVAGMAMYTDWDEIGLVADLGDSWLAYFWETTA
ncbi:MAG: hypothetical protein H6806_04140 [Planctomycetes bacterium]|nr:hypothetical protein [Planctomycetota bacterium]MCB9828945.1 hypothetical protein [Planctomycetota bacterium]MCB9901801.1 hypothetical protein [Planctomycetota bacterium]